MSIETFCAVPAGIITIVESRASRRILLVDDDETVLRGVGRLLGSFGFEVVCCTRGMEARDVLMRDRDFLALITDVNMPELSGLELITDLVAAGIEIPCLLMSGQFVRSALEHRRLAKPFTPDELRAGLASLGLLSLESPNG